MMKTVLNPGWFQVWTVEEMTEIIHNARRIEADPSLRVNSDGSHVRGLGHWERIQLDCYEDIIGGRIWAKG